ncbi:right-handed parallel beta-helix repeat-containing protein [Saccharicrinis sp. FJH62]|uniref:right-handed parallel beta-helix repeat-containing protein n=1 Tax=Saccharicrinis sp. FJH62 TaxID=3344657 RepID=UPI0035D3FD01
MKNILTFILLILGISAGATTYYVDTNGTDSNSGTSVDLPFKTITKALNQVTPGDSILVRGGIHNYSSTIYISKSGTENDTCYLFAYPGERPVLNFSGTDFGKRGISLTGSYWYIKGFDITKAGDNGLNISGGSHNTIEFCSFSENKDTGAQLGGGAHDNTFINCDSYYNADPTDYGDADGYAPKLDVGSNNKFIGCRAWGNCDDGWDGYMRGTTNVTTILENCWTWGNGWLKDGTNPGSQANGNGFKMGGGDNGNSAMLEHHFYLTNCMAFYNKGKGFDQNNNVGTMSMLNCTAYRNTSSNFKYYKTLAAGESLIIKNCISYQGTVDIPDFAVQATNSWLMTTPFSADDFASIDTTGISGPRKADGSLPDVPFMHLVSGSVFIDAGTDVGLPYNGSAPDLGAFEFSANSGFQPAQFDDVKTFFSNGILNIQFSVSIDEPVNASLYTISGQKLYSTSLDQQVNKITVPGLQRGIYLLQLGNGRIKKTVKVLN